LLFFHRDRITPRYRVSAVFFQRAAERLYAATFDIAAALLLPFHFHIRYAMLFFYMHNILMLLPLLAYAVYTYHAAITLFAARCR